MPDPVFLRLEEPELYEYIEKEEDFKQSADGRVLEFVPNAKYGGRRVVEVHDTSVSDLLKRYPHVFRRAEELETNRSVARLLEVIAENAFEVAVAIQPHLEQAAVVAGERAEEALKAAAKEEKRLEREEAERIAQEAQVKKARENAERARKSAATAEENAKQAEIEAGLREPDPVEATEEG